MSIKYENISNNYADVLESYVIPAEEGFVFSQIKEKNIDKLNEKHTLVVFTTDDSLAFGGINPKKYITRYNYTNAIGFPIDNYIMSIITNEKISFDNNLKEFLDKNIKLTDDMRISEAFKLILDACDKYSIQTNILIVAYMTATARYSMEFMKKYPLIITHQSMIKSVLNSLRNKQIKTVRQLKEMYKSFEVFDNKIPKSLFIKDNTLQLYHISKNPNLKELEPRPTSKPFIAFGMARENITIPRVSASPTVDGCFRAILDTVDIDNGSKFVYHVYKLLLSNNHRVVKPSTDLVVDVLDTNEYWVLDPVKVKYIGSIEAILNGDKWDYDTTNMKEEFAWDGTGDV